MFWLLYNLIFVPVYLLLIPRFFWRMWRRGGYRKDFGQRFGIYRPPVRERLAGGGRVWVHAVSVGEVGLALRFMAAWRERADSGQADPVQFVLSVTTSTGSSVALEHSHSDDVSIYFPVDTPWVVKRVLDLVRPRAIIMVEQEFWPNMLRHCRKRGIPSALVNGRISDRSFPRYMKARFATRRVLPLIDRCIVQTQQDAERIQAMGAPADHVVVIPSMKYGTVVQPEPSAVDAARLVLRETGLADKPTLVAGSIWPGEFAAVARAGMDCGFSVVLVPRHFERADVAQRELAELGLRSRLRTEGAKEADVLVVNTTGEMMVWYALADAVFVGKSLPSATGKGGQNLIEPAALGKAVVVGPNMRNFPGVMQDFSAADAVLVAEDPRAPMSLSEAFALVADPARAVAMGERAKAVVENNANSLQRTVDELLRLTANVSPTA